MHDALFVYGSLLAEAKRSEILGHRVEVMEARVDGFERRRGRYFYIVRAAGASTAGLIMRNLSQADWRRLDIYEEVPTLYTREEVEVTTSAGILRCWVYLPTRELVQTCADVSK
ncbi:MAG TPA: gamma-glutamylcyclotransferase family protein [Candidatus Binataceae bacterium]|nr:gamma-glutamylcyclotransferase family protein [Candidatus Binataceae bacterium]